MNPELNLAYALLADRPVSHQERAQTRVAMQARRAARLDRRRARRAAR